MKNVVLIAFCFFLGGIVNAQVEKNVGDFSSLRVSDRIVLDLVKSDENRIEIFGDDAESVVVKNKNGKLVIRMEISKFMQGEDVAATLYFKNLDDLKVANGATVQNSEIVDAKSMVIAANKGGTIALKLQLDNLDAKATSGAQIVVTGKANHFKARINSGASIDAREFSAETADLGVMAGGELTAHVSKTADAQVSMGGDIYIYGNPEVTQKISAGGEVHRMD